MSRQEIAKLLPILQAFAEGKVIQYKDQGIWGDITMEEGLCVENAFVHPNDYRIKPSPTYRPFANAEECWKEMLKHKPFGWVKTKRNSYFYQIISIENANDFSATFKDCTFADGSAFGVKVEE